MRGLPPSELHPLQRVLLPDPDVSHNQDAEKNQHLQQAKQTQQLELYRPGKQEDGLHVEDHEQNGHDVETDGVAATRAIEGRNPTLVGHQLGFEWVTGADDVEQSKRSGRHQKRQEGENEHRYIVLRHKVLSRWSRRSAIRIGTNAPLYRASGRDSMTCVKKSAFRGSLFAELSAVSREGETRGIA